MDIEKLKKVNQLATTLRSQGLATGRDDAVKLAGDMNLGVQDEGLNQIMTSINTPPPEPQFQQPVETRQEAPFMDEEKMTQVLQSFADQFVNEINTMNNKIKEQQETIYKLYTAIESMENSQNPQPVVQQQAPVETQETIQVQEKPKEESPRSGGFNSDDVAIDKFFYYGNK